MEADHGAGDDWACLLLDARRVQERLDDVARRASPEPGTNTECTVGLRHAGYERVVAGTSREAENCDWVQFHAGEGPCLTAMDTGQTVVVDDVTQETRWPTWSQEARRYGFRSVSCSPLALPRPGATVAITLYFRAADVVQAHDPSDTARFAQAVSNTIDLCLQLADLTQQPTDLAAAVETRRLFDEAITEVIIWRRCSTDAAMQLLRQAVIDHGGDLRAAASSLIKTPGKAPANRST